MARWPALVAGALVAGALGLSACTSSGPNASPLKPAIGPLSDGVRLVASSYDVKPGIIVTLRLEGRSAGQWTGILRINT